MSVEQDKEKAKNAGSAAQAAEDRYKLDKDNKDIYKELTES
jgi:hypothetical protein